MKNRLLMLTAMLLVIVSACKKSEDDKNVNLSETTDISTILDQITLTKDLATKTLIFKVESDEIKVFIPGGEDLSTLNFDIEFTDETVVLIMPTDFSFSKSRVIKLKFIDGSTKQFDLLIEERGLLNFEINYLASYKQGFEILGLFNELDDIKSIIPRFSLPEGASSIPKSGELPTFISENKLVYKVSYADGSTEDINVFLLALKGFQIDYLVVKEMLEGIYFFNTLPWKQDITTVTLSDLVGQADDTGKFKLYNDRVYSVSSYGKTICKNIGNLSFLRKFVHDGVGAETVVVIPDSFSKLILLNDLKFVFMKIEEFPEYFSNFIFMTDLYLTGNGLTKFPETILSWTNITNLTIQSNDLSEGVPDGLSALTELRVLRLGGVKLNEIPNFVAKCAKLELLDFEHNNIGENSPDLSELKKLKFIALKGSGITKIPTSLFQNTKLVYSISPSQIISLNESLNKVISLNLSMAFHSGDDEFTAIPQELFNLKNTNSLLIWGKSLESIDEKIGELKNLAKFELKYAEKITSFPSSMGDLSNLNLFHLTGVENLKCMPETFWDLVNSKGDAFSYHVSATGISAKGDIDCED